MIARCWSPRIGVMLALCVALAAFPGASSHAEQEQDPILARAYPVNYRPLADAADLVDPLLSSDGEITLKPRLKTLVVQDRESVLERVAALLERFDLPPRNVELTMALFLGTDRREERKEPSSPDGGLSQEVRGVLEAISNFTKWTDYEPLGSRSVTGVEGGQTTVSLSDDYRVIFFVESVHEGQRAVKIRNFSLQRVRREEDGSQRYVELYTSDMVLPVGRLHVVGAAAGADAKRALFLTLQAQTR